MALSGDALIQSFESERRRRLLRLLIPAGITLTVIAALSGFIALIQGQAQAGMPLTVTLTTILALAMGSAYYVLQQGQVELATNIFVASAVVTVLGIVTIFSVVTPFSAQSLVQIACLSIVVTLAGAVGGTRSIVAAAALESLVISLIVALAPAEGILAGAGDQQRPAIIIGTLTYHWAIAALLVAVARAQRLSLERLSQIYEELTRAQQVDSLKDQFITQVNHELRTPIMSLQGYVDLIYELDGTLTPSDRRSMLEKARSAGETLTRFVNDVLDTRRVDQDTDFERVGTPVRPTIADALMVIPPHETRPTRVDVPGELAVWGDPTRLLQVLTNLITNAIKYSPAGTPIEIAARQIDQFIEISVRDYGLGIPPEQVTALFHRFVRLERDLRSPVRGTGVGLYLCRMYVEAMGGTIVVESTGIPGQGSRFIVRLPAFEGANDTPTLTPTRKLGRIQA